MATTSPPNKLTPRHIVKDNDLSTWDLAWWVSIHSSVHSHYNDLPSRRQNVTPWDKGDVQPSLKEAVESSGIEFPREGRAFVPGCGSVGFPPPSFMIQRDVWLCQGYDVFYFASALGYDSLGLDGAQTAVDVANK